MTQITPQLALNKAMTICSKAERCVSDIEKKLLEWKIEPSDVQKIIQILQQEKFIDESRYAAYFVNDKFRFNKWGKVKIGFMLKGKRISQEIIQSALKQIDEQNYYTTLVQLLQQKLKSIKAQSEYEMKAKLIRFAQARGYEYEVIAEVLSDILSNS